MIRCATATREKLVHSSVAEECTNFTRSACPHLSPTLQPEKAHCSFTPRSLPSETTPVHARRRPPSRPRRPGALQVQRVIFNESLPGANSCFSSPFGLWCGAHCSIPPSSASVGCCFCFCCCSPPPAAATTTAEAEASTHSRKGHKG